MLKWLKQKPTGPGPGITTDDPLATITVQNGPTTKISLKSSSNGNGEEVYAVSRINPLFEEEDLILPISAKSIPGKSLVGSPEFPTNSGSSGYDSADGDDEQNHEKLHTKHISPAPPNLFSDQHDILIHHQASRIVQETHAQPVLHIVQQNPSYVQSIAVTVSPQQRTHNKPRNLSPVPESSTSTSVPSQRKRVQVPMRSGTSATKSGDPIGSAVMLQKSPQYVQSVRIGRGNNGPRGIDRKPSVTFSEKVDILRGMPSSRKSSAEHDSIVTDSLLHMMTSGSQLMVQQHGSKRIRSQIPPPPNVTTITAAQVHHSPTDLENFSNSLSKNRMVKQIVSRSSSGGGLVESDDDESKPSPTIVSLRHRNASTSPFGGIADHYAAAKEIAKEIESYGNTTTHNPGIKPTKKISLVRDLLRNRSNTGNDGNSSGSSGRLLKTAVVQVRPVISSPSLYVKVKDEKDEGSRMTTTTSRRGHDGHIQVPQEELISNIPTTTTTNGNHRRHPHSHKVPVDYTEGQRQNQNQQVPIYEALPSSTHHPHHRRGDDSDSGNSTDRGNKEDESSPSTRPSEPSRPPPPLPPSNSPNPHPTKVMIVSGDSQNMLVDLSGVPEELRIAIISGTALVTLPDGLNQNLEPGYAMVPVGNHKENEYEILPSTRKTPPSSTNQRDGKDYEQIEIDRDRGKYGTTNKAQVWNMIQSGPLGHVQGQKSSSHSHHGKKFTTVQLPYHPNQDAHTTADFTIEGQRLSKQTKRVKRLKTRRCVCRIFGILLFLGAFIGVIITLSLVYTKGKHYFGPV